MDTKQLKKTLAGLSVATLLAGACLASPVTAASG
ncbi:MAG TPA: SbtA family thio(seleno)oxazole RiPP natural product precursor [Dissulfurispiraceae bacterium]|nr:SbtA family thio(seleno)oxazole RiPP natural product precursor [Dissulfurispiraceae bacterium]